MISHEEKYSDSMINLPLSALFGCSEAVTRNHSQVYKFRGECRVTRLLLQLIALDDVGVLPVGEAAGEDADASCTVSLQPLLIDCRRCERKQKEAVRLTSEQTGGAGHFTFQ